MRGMTVSELIQELQRLEPNREVFLVLSGDETEPVTRENLRTAEGKIMLKPYMAAMKPPKEDGEEQGNSDRDRCWHASDCIHFWEVRG